MPNLIIFFSAICLTQFINYMLKELFLTHYIKTTATYEHMKLINKSE